MIPIRPPSRLFALVPAAIALLAALNLDVPYRAISPGPLYPVGELISIDGARTYPLEGDLFLTTVQLGPVKLAGALRGWLDPHIDVIEAELIVPPGVSEEEADRQQTKAMTESQRTAAAAALSLLGYDVRFKGGGVVIERLVEGYPAARVLQAEDVVLQADGRRLCDAAGLQAAVRSRPVGDPVPLQVRRGGQTIEVKVPTQANPDGSPMIGVEIRQDAGEVVLPFDVDIDARGIGGPSAGLVFALGIVDLLQEGDLTGGRDVAATGVITCGGEVGPVGGVSQKVVSADRSGADLFLVPRAELEAACRAADRIRVLGVDTLRDAVEALRDPDSAEGCD